MGYRFYFYAVPKNLAEKIQKCKTNAEYISICREAEKLIEDDEDEYCPPYCLGEEVYEFGKEIDFYDDIYKNENNHSLFSETLKEYYSDYGAIVCGQESFLDVIEAYRKRIIIYLNNLLEEKSPDYFDERTKVERQEWDIKQRLDEWDNNWCRPYNLNLDNKAIVTSWMYEYSIFELINCYKNFDWENNVLVFLGW